MHNLRSGNLHALSLPIQALVIGLISRLAAQAMALRNRPWPVLLALALLLASPNPVASANWGSSQYGDPPGFCPNLSPMWYEASVTNDPNYDPESQTFWGIHKIPGYDNWYGYWYGDFRGQPNDVQPWKFIVQSIYPNHYSWYPSDWGWAFHGHVKQYIAYYNPTFGGQCGMGAPGQANPPPYMADVYGYPVTDIYVDTTPPQVPQPFVSGLSLSSLTLSWNSVVDLGDGAGSDYFAVGLAGYTYWVTENGRPLIGPQSITAPTDLSFAGLSGADKICLFVNAYDKLGNTSAPGSVCSAPLQPPSLASLSLPVPEIAINPAPNGFAGIPTDYSMQPLSTVELSLASSGITYLITAVPSQVAWNFGDGDSVALPVPSGFGSPYPAPSSVTHQYQSALQSGYRVSATVTYQVYWQARLDGALSGPYSFGAVDGPPGTLIYPVLQVQPVVQSVG